MSILLRADRLRDIRAGIIWVAELICRQDRVAVIDAWEVRRYRCRVR